MNNPSGPAVFRARGARPAFLYPCGLRHHVQVQSAGESPLPIRSERGTRAGRSPRDMALSLLVLLVPVFLLVYGYRVFFSGDARTSVDTAQTVADARRDAGFPVLAPGALPKGWTASSATFEKGAPGSVLRLGYLAADGAGLQLVESDRPADQFLPGELGTDAQPGNLVTIGGRQWRSYPSARGGTHGLVLAQDRDTIVIVGTGGDEDLRALAASLA